MAISTGVGIMVSQYFGARDRDALSRSIGNALVLVLITGVLMTVAGVALSRPIMEWLDTPVENDVLEMSVTYLTIIFAGIIGPAIYNMVSGILRGMGDSVTPLIFLLIACALNIVLDYLLVAIVPWGVAGAAVATIFSQLVSAVLCVLRLFRMRDAIDLNRRTVRLDMPLTRRLLKLGLPAGITQGVFSMAMIIVQSLTNSMGQTVMACSVAVMRVDGFAMLPNFTFGMATSTFVGQNIGARRMDRVEQGAKEAVKLSLLVAVILVVLLLLFGRTLISWFSSTEELLDLGERQLRILAVGYLAMAVMPGLFRHHARRGRYHAVHVDFAGDVRGGARAGGVPAGRVDPVARMAQRLAGQPVRFAAGQLGAGRGAQLRLVPPGPLARKKCGVRPVRRRACRCLPSAGTKRPSSASGYMNAAAKPGAAV